MAFSPETYALIMGKGGAAGGFATLNGSGKIPESQLPSYVDDVVEGYYYNDKFYADAQHTEEITAATGKIYIDLTTGVTYRWGGSVYIPIGGGKPVSVTVTLASNAWSNNAQTVTVTGVLADETKQLIQPVPASASSAEYESCGVKATAQAADSLTFSCDTTPTNNLTVYVVITEVAT